MITSASKEEAIIYHWVNNFSCFLERKPICLDNPGLSQWRGTDSQLRAEAIIVSRLQIFFNRLLFKAHSITGWKKVGKEDSKLPVYNWSDVQSSMVAFAVCTFDVLLFSTLIRNCVREIGSVYNLSTVVLDDSCESRLRVPNLLKHREWGSREESSLPSGALGEDLRKDPIERGSSSTAWS